MASVKIGLIGLGFMGTTHYGIYSGLPDAKLCAIADIDPAKRSGDISVVCGNIGGGDNRKPLNLDGIQIFSDPFEMIRESDLDIIDICVPTCNHAELILASLKAGKHVFSEKPLCRTPEEMLAIADAAARSSCFFNVGLCLRAWPEYHYTAERIHAGTWGLLHSAVFRRLSPSVSGNGWHNWFIKNEMSGGALLDLHTHDSDIIRHFFGRPSSVRSFGKTIIGDCGIDHVVTTYSFPDSNALVVAEGGWGAAKSVPFEMGFQLIFERATVRFGAEGLKVHWNDGRIESPFAPDSSQPTGWHRELAYFVDCVKQGIKPEHYQTLREVLDSACIVFAEQKSVEMGKDRVIDYV